METTTITELLRDPKRVIRRLDRASEVIIERRDAAPLSLSLSSRAETEREGAALLARLLLKALPELLERVWVPLVDVYPWLRFLPDNERATFIRDFAETIESCASIGNNAPLAQLVREWKATASVHADSALATALKRPSAGTKAKVPRPKVRR